MARRQVIFTLDSIEECPRCRGTHTDVPVYRAKVGPVKYAHCPNGFGPILLSELPPEPPTVKDLASMAAQCAAYVARHEVGETDAWRTLAEYLREVSK